MRAIPKSAKIHPAAKKCCGLVELAIWLGWSMDKMRLYQLTRPHTWIAFHAEWKIQRTLGS